jgi:hypothetical protein
MEEIESNFIEPDFAKNFDLNEINDDPIDTSFINEKKENQIEEIIDSTESIEEIKQKNIKEKFHNKEIKNFINKVELIKPEIKIDEKPVINKNLKKSGYFHLKNYS